MSTTSAHLGPEIMQEGADSFTVYKRALPLSLLKAQSGCGQMKREDSHKGRRCGPHES